MLHFIMLASGFAGLGYQIVWTQQFSLWLGHDSAALLAVVAGFFGGLAAGALALAPRIERSVWPQRWYAACEVLIGAWSLLLAVLVSPASGWLLQLTGAQPAPGWQWTVAFCGSFLLLLPATAAMGATLPALRRMLAPADAIGASIAKLYAANTAGAMLGVLASAFWLVPAFGLLRTAAVCVALNIVCALLALSLGRGDRPPLSAQPIWSPLPRRLAAQLAATGLLGIGYEVLVVRVLSQVAENTVYTFAMLLAVYLLGTALGAAAWQRRAGARAGPDDAGADRLLWQLSAACLLGTFSLWGAASIKAGLLHAFGASLVAALAAEALLALLAFLPPTLLMGALFSCLAARAVQQGMGLGRALGINTLGAAAAPLVFGVGLMPVLGAKLSLLALAAAYLLLLSRPAWTSGRARWAPAGLAGALVMVAVLAPPLRFVDVPPGGRILSFEEGAMAAVSVVEDADGVARLHINNRQQEGSSDSFDADARQALLPLLLHPAPRRALFLGLGTGVTARAAAADPQLRVDAVELLPEVIAASAHFSSSAGPSPNLLAADARRFVRAGADRYDVIVSDNFHPARSGSWALYTVEHFNAVRGRLAHDGLFCQWLPLHQLDLASLRSIVAAFIAAYPNGHAVLATHSLQTPVLGLVGRADGAHFDMSALQSRMASAAPALRHAELGLADPLAVVGSFVSGPASLAQFAAGAAINSDDHPVVSYRAPRITYAPDSLPRDRLLALLDELRIAPAELIGTPASDEWGPRLAAYWRARDAFLRAGRRVQPSADVRQMLAQVQQPLLDVLRTSPDFAPAYDPLLRMASALVQSDRESARRLLAELDRIQPARPEAGVLLRQLGTGPR